MNIKNIIYAIVLLTAGAFSIATSSIAIQCGNSMSATYKADHPANQNFLIVNLVCGILIVMLALFGMYAAFAFP